MTDQKHPSESRVRESVSAVLDGETNELELHRILSQLDRGADVRQAAYRYGLIGEVVRGRSECLQGIDLSSNIRSAIDDEFNSADTDHLSSDANGSADPVPEHSAINRGASRWSHRLGRVAIAASVTLAVVFGGQTYNAYIQENSSPLVAVDAPVSVQSEANPEVNYVPSFARESIPVGVNRVLAGYDSKPGHTVPSSDQLARAQELSAIAARRRFEGYMLQHAEQMSLYNNQSLLPFARVAAAEH